MANYTSSLLFLFASLSVALVCTSMPVVASHILGEPTPPINDILSEPTAPSNDILSEPTAPASNNILSEPTAASNDPNYILSEPTAPSNDPHNILSEPTPPSNNIVSEPTAPSNVLSEPTAPTNRLSSSEPITAPSNGILSEPAAPSNDSNHILSEPTSPSTDPNYIPISEPTAPSNNILSEPTAPSNNLLSEPTAPSNDQCALDPDAPKTTVSILNALPGSEIFKIHCKSKDDDLGLQVIEHGQSYKFTFRPNFQRTTLYYGGISWSGASKDFVIYDYNRDNKRCCGKVDWIVRPDGLFSPSVRKGETDVFIPWN